MDNASILLITAIISLLGGAFGLTAASSINGGFFNAGCVFYGFWTIYFGIPMFDMATRRQMEPILYAAGGDALTASCYAVVLGFVIFTFVYFPYRQRVSLHRHDHQYQSFAAPPSQWFFYCSFVLLMLGSVGKLYILSSFGGVSVELLMNLSHSFRRENEVHVSAVWFLIASLFDCGLYMLLFYSILRYRSATLAVLIVFIGVLLTFIIGGKRISALTFVVAAATWYIMKYNLPSKLQATLVLTALAISTIGLVARISVPTWLSGSDEHIKVAYETVTNPIKTVLDSGELGLFEGTNFAFESRSEFLLDFSSGPHLLLYQTVSSAAYIIPRIVWPDKPEIFDFSQMFYSLVVADGRLIGWGIGPLGVGYIWGGWFGVILTMLIVAMLARVIDLRVMRHSTNKGLMFAAPFILVLFFHLLRFGSPGFVIVYLYMNLLPVVCVCCLLFVAHTFRRHKTMLLHDISRLTRTDK